MECSFLARRLGNRSPQEAHTRHAALREGVDCSGGAVLDELLLLVLLALLVLELACLFL